MISPLRLFETTIILLKWSKMPHTINLVSQFEDIIRRGGNELENNLSSAVKTGRGSRTGSKRKRSPRRRSSIENDDEPPPIPKRAPIVPRDGRSNDSRNKYINPEEATHFRNEYQAYNPHDENEGGIFTISDITEVR